MKIGWWSVVAAGVLVGVGIVLLVVGQVERGLVQTATQLLELDFDSAAHSNERGERFTRFARRLPWINDLNATMHEQRLVAEYWRAHDTSLTTGVRTGPVPADAPATRLVLANAAYRAINLDATRPEVIEQLQKALGQYAEVLKLDSSNFDAAYNYQFVARLRDQLARAPRGAARVPGPYVPLDRSLHGREGDEAPGLDLNEFKVITPHESDERREEQEAGKNAPRVRKG